MQFRLSVFYRDGYFNYRITTADKKTFQFTLNSAPAGKEAPEAFTVMHEEKEQWTFNQEMDEAFKEAVIAVLKRAKL